MRPRQGPAAPGAGRASAGRWLLRLFGLTLMLGAFSLPLLRTPDRSVETLVARWAPPPSQFMDLQGQLVHYRDEGPRDDAEPLLLLHGTSASLHTWEGWARALRGQRRVISLDLPAYGLTGPWAGPFVGQPYTAEAYTGFVLQVLDKLAVKRFVAIGNSLGGEVAWRLAQRAPERVTRLVLVDASGYRFEPGSLPMAWRLARVPLLSGLIEQLMARPLIVQGLSTVMADPRHITDTMVDRYVELTLREGNRHAFVQRARHWTPGEGVDKISGLSLPTLILWGAMDRLIPPALAQRFAADVPGSQVVVFDDLGHVPQEEDPLRSVAPVKAFLGWKAEAGRGS